MSATTHATHGWGQYPAFCPECKAELAESANTAQREHDAAIDDLVCKFTGGAVEAVAFVTRIQQTVSKLVHPSVYDIEMAEGSTGTDAIYELDAALRHLRNVERIARDRHRLLLEKEGVPTFD